MEKIVWIYNSPGKDEKAHMNALNKLLSEGWRVKMMSACASVDYSPASHLYIVLEKQEKFTMLDLIVRLLFCHLLGDYVLQTPFLAETKGRNWYHMFAHCTLYSLPFYIFFGLNWQLAVLFFSHLCIDTAKARYQKISYVADQALHYCILLTYIISS